MKTLIGFHSVTGRLRQKPDTISEIYVDAERNDGRARDLKAMATKAGVRVIPVDAKRLESRRAVRREHAVHETLQAIGLLDDHLRVFAQLRLVELALKQLSRASQPA